MKSLDLADLREQNATRMRRWHQGADDWTGADWSNAMCGEAGEAANVVKKLRRHETGIGAGPQAYPGIKDPDGSGLPYNTPPSDDLGAMLAAELADIVCYVDLLAYHYGIDLAAAVVAKFNQVSQAQGFPERLP